MSRLFSNKFNSYKLRTEEKINYKRKIFIAYEGVRTEPKYFSRMNCYLNSQNKYNVELFLVDRFRKDGRSHPKHVRDGIIEYYEEISKDFIPRKDCLFIVIDIDDHFGDTPEKVAFNYNEYLHTLITKDGIKISAFVSNPCFELWLILQFEIADNLDLVKLKENEVIGNTTYCKSEYSKLRNKFKDLPFINAVNNARRNSISPLLENKLERLHLGVGTNLNELFEYILGPELSTV